MSPRRAWRAVQESLPADGIIFGDIVKDLRTVATLGPLELAVAGRIAAVLLAELVPTSRPPSSSGKGRRRRRKWISVLGATVGPPELTFLELPGRWPWRFPRRSRRRRDRPLLQAQVARAKAQAKLRVGRGAGHNLLTGRSL